MLPVFQTQVEGEAYFRDPANYHKYINDDSRMGSSMLTVFKNMGWNVPAPPNAPVAPTTPANGHSTRTEVAVAAADASGSSAQVAEQTPQAETIVAPNFLDIARAAVARGEKRILPIQVGGKNPIIKWAHEPIHNASTAEWEQLYTAWIDELAVKFSNANACTVARADENLYIDEDLSSEFRKGYEVFAGEPFPRTHTTSGRPNRCQSGWLQTDYSRAKLWNITQGKTRDQMFSLRFHNMYVISEGSLHKTGSVYAPVDNSPLVPIPDKLVDYILSCVVNSTLQRANCSQENAQGTGGNWFATFSLDAPFVHGDIDNAVKDFIWYFIKEKNISDGEELFEKIEDCFEANGCYEPDGVTSFSWNRKQIRDKCHAKVKSIKTGAQDREDATAEALAKSAKIASDALAAPISPVQPPTLNLNTQPDAPATNVSTVGGLLIDPSDKWEFAISPEEYEIEIEKEYPVIPLKEGPGPTWDDSIMYGIAGDIVRKAAVYNEAHPAGMYLDLIVSFGNLVGRDPYFNVNATQHFANEFMVRVGETATSRKGTGRDAINELLHLIDPKWYAERVRGGFGSAEAIINELRDESMQTIRGKEQFVPGVKDKRLMIREGELASIFQLAGKAESRADIVLRDGWDSKALHNLVKGKTGGFSNSASCQYPHISISADTTRSELLAKLPPGAESNGFGNRFLYCYVRRVKKCPSGGPQVNWLAEIQKLHEFLMFARELRYVGMCKSANAVWNRMYLQIEQENEALSGLAASMTARAAAHVRRLALILCLMDGPDLFGTATIETHHLHAAKRIWDYCEDSARYIFGGLTKDQEMILGWVRKNGSVTIPQITQRLYHKNRKADWVRTQVNGLIQAGKLVANGEQIAARQ